MGYRVGLYEELGRCYIHKVVSLVDVFFNHLLLLFCAFSGVQEALMGDESLRRGEEGCLRKIEREKELGEIKKEFG